MHYVVEYNDKFGDVYRVEKSTKWDARRLIAHIGVSSAYTSSYVKLIKVYNDGTEEVICRY